MDAITAIVASNLRILREQRRLSLDALSSMTGVSKSMLGMIERGVANPTISTLWKIANGVGVPFTHFMAQPGNQVEVRRLEDILPLIPDEGVGYRNYPLFPLDESRSFEVYAIEIDPEGWLQAEPHAPETQEIITVFSGTLEVRIGDRSETLPAGTSIRFHADIAHAYFNVGNDICKLSMVISYAFSGKKE